MLWKRQLLVVVGELPQERELAVEIQVDRRERRAKPAPLESLGHIIAGGQRRVEVAEGAEAGPLGLMGTQLLVLPFGPVAVRAQLDGRLLQPADGTLERPDKAELPE